MVKRNPTRSRLSRHVERQSRKTLFLSILGILVVVFFIFQFGIPLLIRFSVLVGDLTQTTETNVGKESHVLLPPKLSPLPEATNSARLRIEGIATKDTEVAIFLNDKLVETTDADENGNFVIESLRLKSNKNRIKARIEDKEGNKSDFSDETFVTFDDESPKLEISQPPDNQTLSKDNTSVTVSGKTEANVRVTVNGFWAVVDNEGNFSYTLPLSSGENKITIEAIDAAGNKTTAERKIILSQ